MNAQKIKVIMQTPPNWELDGASFWMLDTFNGSQSWIARFERACASPWELHRDGEELFHILEGTVELMLLTATSSERVKVQAGERFVVPRQTWHRVACASTATTMGATKGRTEYSLADDLRMSRQG